MKTFIDLEGASGATYRFRLWEAGAPHQPIAGNYVCVRADKAGYAIVGIGETLDLSQLRGKLSKRVREAATHVYTRLNVARANREAEHADLMARHGTTRSGPARARAPASPADAPATNAADAAAD
jgi:hypothetical protein